MLWASSNLHGLRKCACTHVAFPGHRPYFSLSGCLQHAYHLVTLWSSSETRWWCLRWPPPFSSHFHRQKSLLNVWETAHRSSSAQMSLTGLDFKWITYFQKVFCTTSCNFLCLQMPERSSAAESDIVGCNLLLLLLSNWYEPQRADLQFILKFPEAIFAPF